MRRIIAALITIYRPSHRGRHSASGPGGECVGRAERSWRQTGVRSIRMRSRVFAVSAFVLVGLWAPIGSSASTAPANEPLSSSQLRGLLNAQDLPTTERLPVTEESHPFNGAAWQNKPINLARYGYV